MKILLTGANGYIGMRLLVAFGESEHEVVAVVRNAARIPADIRALFGARLTVLEADFLEEMANQPTCPSDVDAAYYLIHSMGGKDFEKREAACAQAFVDWLEPTKCRQIIYLSGLVPDEAKLSAHLTSRERVSHILEKSEIATTTLRASIIVGSGSASFEIIRDLVEKLPVMIVPKWARTKCQPIAIRNVIDYLTGVLGRKECLGRSFDIGGPDVMPYLDMLKGFARVRKLRRWLISVPYFSPKLSSYWLSLVTATNYQLAKTLVGSMHMQTICRENSIRDLIPLDLLNYEEAIERAFSKIAQNRVPSTWYGALSSGTLSLQEIRNIKVPEFGTLSDLQSTNLTAPKNEVIDALWAIGGKAGWPNLLWAWKLRGFMDTLIGGIGMRRGRRSPTDLKPGDALDFWRVILADKEAGRLMLFAEMKLPGEAWLEFSVEDGKLTQCATFRPRGLLGRLYWLSVYPFHLILFPRMARILANGWKNRTS